MPEPADELGGAEVLQRDLVHEGMVWDIVRDTFDLGEAGQLTREYVAHPGAVAVLALDDDGNVLVIQQYRHPIRARDWELPAGLLDLDGEPAQEAAARELYEEADVRARRWHLLLDHWSSPGGSSEALRIFLAREVTEVPAGERHERHGEELGMPTRWVPLSDLVAGVLEGRLHNPTLVIGVLAAEASRRRGWVGLRAADEPWPTHGSGRYRGR